MAASCFVLVEVLSVRFPVVIAQCMFLALAAGMSMGTDNTYIFQDV
jgi:hypothetical protein